VCEESATASAEQVKTRSETNSSIRCRAAKQVVANQNNRSEGSARRPRLIKTRSELKFIVDFAARESISGNLIIADATLRNVPAAENAH
jgi:hypothetical protein